jgi:autotransporter-associated beta strand protein
MRKIYKLVPAVVLAVASAEASAQLVYEPFDYGSNSINKPLDNPGDSTNNGGYTNPQNGYKWFQTGTNTAFGQNQVVSGNVSSPPGGVAATGNQVLSGKNKGSRLQVAGLAFNSGSIFYSLNLNVTDITNLSFSPSFIFGLNNGQGSQGGAAGIMGARLRIQKDAVDPTKFDLGVQNATEAVQWVGGVTPTQFSTNTPLFIVGAYTFSSGNDPGQIWVNPDASTFGAGDAPAASASTAQDMSAAANTFVGSFAVRSDNSTVPDAFNFDQVRIGTNWAQVTPPTGNTWAGAQGSEWNAGENWSAATVPNAGGQFVNFTGAGGSIAMNTNQTVGTITINSTGGYTLGGASTLTMNGNRPSTSDTSGTAAINVLAITDPTTGAVQSGSHQISVPISLANVGTPDQAALELNVASGQMLTLSGAISGVSGAGLSKSGDGTAVLSGANTFTGGVRIIGGTLQVTSDAALGAAPAAPAANIRLRTGGKLQFGSAFALDPNRTIQIENFVNNFFPTFGEIDTNGHDVVVASLIDGGGATGGSLVKSGDGVLELTNTGNTQAGNIINQGTLRADSDASLGDTSGTITLNTGTLQFGGSFGVSNTRTISVRAVGGSIDTNGNNVTFGGVVSGAGTLIKTGDGQLTLGGLNSQGGTRVNGGVLNIINDANLGAASGTLTLDGGTLLTSTDYTSGRTVAIGDNGGTFATNAHNVSVGTVEGTGSFTKATPGQLTVTHVRSGDLSVTGGTLAIASTGGQPVGVSVVGAVSTSANSLIDLTDNKLISTTAGQTGTWDGSKYTGISGLVQSARGTGNWSGTTGITSSTAASNANPKLFSIGVVKAGDIKSIADDATATFAGQTVHGSDTIAMYTYGGDANLDGKINIDDYGLIDSHVGQSGTAFGWHNGDFNYDGKINIDDYGIIDGNIGAQGAPIPTSAGALALADGGLEGVAAVPEPASMGLLLLSAGALLSRRRVRA